MVYVAYVSIDAIRSSNMSLQAERVVEDDDTVCSKCNAEFHGIVHKRFHCSGHLVM